MKAGRTGIFESHPNSQTVRFAGKYICLSALARATGVTTSYLSLLFSGKRNPSLTTLRSLATALEMSLDDFSNALDSRSSESKVA